jgi:hypothetical protein
MTRISKKPIVLLALVLAVVPMAFPQAATSGSISGTVKDQSGGVVPGAEVNIVNVGTSATRTVNTDDTGFFTAPNMPPGKYSVEVSLSGFKSAKVPVELNVRDNRVANITLEPGTPTDVVSVESTNVSQVELRSGEVGNLISGHQVTELPLNGRSFVQLTLLVPGVSLDNSANVRNTGLFGAVDMSVSGSATNANMWLVDGANNVDIGSGRTILVYPSVDSIAEFRVQRNSYGPEMGASSGAQINVITKGGTNAFHGSAYEFFRNDVLNANTFFLNRANQEKAPLRYNNFGYTLGGPALKDKLFFFWSQEWRRELRGVTRRANVPTELERVGDFSGPRSRSFPTPTDPFTGDPFPDNKIPSSRLSPFGLALLKLYPLPTPGATAVDATGQIIGDNWVGAPITPIKTRQEQIRVDYNLTKSNSLMTRFTKDTRKNLAPSYVEAGLWGDDPFPAVDSDWDQPGYSLATQWTATIGTSTINQFNFSWSGNRIRVERGSGADINDAIVAAQPEVYPGPAGHGHSGFWGSPGGGDLWTQGPWNNIQDLYVWKDDFSRVIGEHSVKIGGLYSRNKKDEDINNNSAAFAPFFWGPSAIPGPEGLGGGWGPYGPGNGGQVTGNGLADLLLRGTVWGGTEHSDNPRSRVRWRDFETYVSDTWRMTPRLTLTYGFRWSYLPAGFDAEDNIGSFILDLYDPAEGRTSTNGMIYPNDLRGIDVARGLVKNHWNNIGPRLGLAWDPTGQGKWAIRAGFGSFYNREAISDVLSSSLNPPFDKVIFYERAMDELPRNIPDPGVGVAQHGKSIDGKTPASYQWNLTVERELFRDTKLEVAYVANRGYHLPGQMNLNQVPVNLRPQFVRFQYDNDDATDQDTLRSLYPLVGSGSMIEYTRGFDSMYHALQVYLVKRFSNNLSYQASYTWSKTLSTGNLQYISNNEVSDNSNMAYDKGLAALDRPHIFTANVIWRTPALAGSNNFLKGVLGNWETSLIVTANSGIPLTIECCNALAGGITASRPDQIRDPNKGPKTVDQWFDTGAFIIPPDAGRLGYSARGQVRSPGIHNWDVAIHKNFPGIPWFTQEKASLQFRAEMFNVWNHTNFYEIGTTMGEDNITVDTTALRVTGYRLTNTDYGRVTRIRDPREVQFALKILW